MELGGEGSEGGVLAGGAFEFGEELGGAGSESTKADGDEVGERADAVHGVDHEAGFGQLGGDAGLVEAARHRDRSGPSGRPASWSATRASAR